MNRDKYIEKRSGFCKRAYENPSKAARELRIISQGLKNCRTTNDIVFALSEIFCVSERTIWNDIKNGD